MQAEDKWDNKRDSRVFGRKQQMHLCCGSKKGPDWRLSSAYEKP